MNALEETLKRLTGRSSEEIEMLNEDLKNKSFEEVCEICNDRFKAYMKLLEKHYFNSRIVRIAKVKHQLAVAEFLRRNKNSLENKENRGD